MGLWRIILIFSILGKVECTFGDIDLQWGILWRPLSFMLAQIIKVIDLCMRLHNFITEFCQQHSFPVNRDKTIFNKDCCRVFLHNKYRGVCGGEDDCHHHEDGSILHGGHPTSNNKHCTEFGKHSQDNLCTMISKS